MCVVVVGVCVCVWLGGGVGVGGGGGGWGGVAFNLLKTAFKKKITDPYLLATLWRVNRYS